MHLGRDCGEPRAEHLLKVFFAEHGTKADLLATIDTVRHWADDQMAVHAAVARTYLDGTSTFQTRAAQNALVGQFLADFVQLVDHWAEWAEATADGWPDDIAAAEPDWTLIEEQARRLPRRRSRATP